MCFAHINSSAMQGKGPAGGGQGALAKVFFELWVLQFTGERGGDLLAPALWGQGSPLRHEMSAREVASGAKQKGGRRHRLGPGIIPSTPSSQPIPLAIRGAWTESPPVGSEVTVKPRLARTGSPCTSAAPRPPPLGCRFLASPLGRVGLPHHPGQA